MAKETQEKVQGKMTPGPTITGEHLMSNPDVTAFLSGIAGNTPAPAITTKSFKNTKVEEAFAKAQTANPIVPPAPDSMTVDLEAATDSVVPPEPVLDPKAQYLESLKKLNISQEEAAKIIDTMMTAGVYEEAVPLTKKLAVVFRTRTPADLDRVSSALNAADPVMSSSAVNLIVKHNIAASLVSYGPYKFTGKDDSDKDGQFRAALDYVTNKIPLPVYQVLSNKLSKFDEKCNAIMSDGASSFF